MQDPVVRTTARDSIWIVGNVSESHQSKKALIGMALPSG